MFSCYHFLSLMMYVLVTPQCGGWYGIYTTEGLRPEDSVNPILIECGVVQPTCTTALGYRKRTKTNFNWTVYLLTS